MGPARILLLKVTALWLADVTALAVTAAGVFGALLLFRIVRDTPMRFLFVRPSMFKLATGGAAAGSGYKPTRPARNLALSNAKA
jgi:hypothetical protein